MLCNVLTASMGPKAKRRIDGNSWIWHLKLYAFCCELFIRWHRTNYSYKLKLSKRQIHAKKSIISDPQHIVLIYRCFVVCNSCSTLFFSFFLLHYTEITKNCFPLPKRTFTEYMI